MTSPARQGTTAPVAMPGTVEHELHQDDPGRRAGLGWVLFCGVFAGLVAGVAMLAWLVFCAEVASDPTPVPGIDSSAWTPLTGITSFLFGVDAFHGDFHALSILFGLFAHLCFSVLFGLIGVALLTYAFAGRPGPVGAPLLGFAYALTVNVLFRDVLVNWIQDVHTVSDALPTWGWWVGHAFYGATLGVVAGPMLATGAPGVTPRGLLAAEEPR